LPEHPPTAATSASDYLDRAAAGSLVELPSGDVVRIGRVDAADLAIAGGIPDRLSRHVFDGMHTLRTEASREADPEAALAKVYRDRVETVDLIACAILREPRMVPEDDPRADSLGPPEGAIYPRHMPWGDRMYLYRVATGEEQAVDLSRFPGRSAPGVHAAPNGDGVLDAAERDPRSAA
jgi:hypothetical protein